MTISEPQTSELRSILRQAVINSSQRCQYQSTKWLAELLDALPEEDFKNDPIHQTHIPDPDPLEADLEQKELPRYLMAKAFFDCREYQRCAAVYLPTLSVHMPQLRGHPVKVKVAHVKNTATICKETSQKGLFLALYALLMVGEKGKQEALGPVLGPSDNNAIINKQLPLINTVLDTWFHKTPQVRRSDGWLEYLYALVLLKGKAHDHAISCLLKSISINPWNWGAWQQVVSLVRDVTHFKWVQSHLKPSLMAYIFSVHCRQELHLCAPPLMSDIEKLKEIFPRSQFLIAQQALVLYRMKFLNDAASLFSEQLASDPRCLDFLSHYSNVLHSLQSGEKLAFIAQLASAVDAYRPETSCVIGHYYSSLSQSEDAIVHFRRALTLDRSYSAAWTLLGHEYLTLENFHTAAESYRHAVEIDNKDYRAFMGLGQAYESLQRPAFALYYYQRALKIRPHDTALWLLITTCLVDMSRLLPAAVTLKKAIACNRSKIGIDPPDAVASRVTHVKLLFQLACLYAEANDRVEAARYMFICLEEFRLVQNDPRVKADVKEDPDFASMLPDGRRRLVEWTGGRSQ